MNGDCLQRFSALDLLISWHQLVTQGKKLNKYMAHWSSRQFNNLWIFAPRWVKTQVLTFSLFFHPWHIDATFHMYSQVQHDKQPGGRGLNNTTSPNTNTTNTFFSCDPELCYELLTSFLGPQVIITLLPHYLLPDITLNYETSFWRHVEFFGGGGGRKKKIKCHKDFRIREWYYLNVSVKVLWLW